MRYMDRAVRNGKVVLLEDLGEDVDGALDPILLKQTYKPAGGGGLVLRLGDNETPYDDNFKLFMTTNIANPHYLPEVCIKVTLLNFTVTRKGLVRNCSADTIAHYRVLCVRGSHRGACGGGCRRTNC
jgi:dynein heavy chain